METLVSLKSHDNRPRLRSSSDSEGRKIKKQDRTRTRGSKEKGDLFLEVKKLRENEADGEKGEDKREEEKGRAEIQIQITNDDSAKQKLKVGDEEDEGAAEEQPSEASDPCHTDSRILTSPSSDSLDALEEDDLISCSSSSARPNTVPETHVSVRSPFQLHLHSDGSVQPHLLGPPPAHSHPLIHLTAVSTGGGEGGGGSCRRSGDGADPQTYKYDSSHSSGVQNPSGDSSLCFAELSRLADLLPSPPEASEEDEEEELRRRRNIQREISVRGGGESREGGVDPPCSPSPSSPSSHKDYIFNFDQSDARCYYNLCSNITPDSALSPPHPHHQEAAEGGEAEEVEPTPILQPPHGFGDSSSDEEFFDARDGFASPEDPTSGAVQRGDSDSSQEGLVFLKWIKQRIYFRESRWPPRLFDSHKHKNVSLPEILLKFSANRSLKSFI